VVRTTQLYNRLAFSLIEVVFTIVVVGVIIMSLPSMTSVSSKSIENSLVQEAIFAASAELNQATSYYWDRNSLDVNGTSSLSKVINLNNDCNATTKLRPGHINQAKHRTCLNDTSITTTADTNDTTVQNLNNAVGSSDTFEDTTGTFAVSAEGYKEALTTDVSISFADFGAATALNKNIKKITATIKDSQGNDIVVLSTYSANIGEVDYEIRSYQ